MSIALLATGDEIITGDTLNTNSHQIAHALTSENLEIGLHLTCGDNEEQIFNCMQMLTKHHDILIIIGGLGPTSDDRTRFALARFLNQPLIEFPEAINHIQKRLNSNDVAINKGNQQQALFPPSASLFHNPHGTAMGCLYEQNGKLFFLLPGPPRECLPMFQAYVLTRLQNTQHRNRQWHKWLLFGVAESQIAEQFDTALKDIDCQTGYRVDYPYVECKVLAAPHLMPAILHRVMPIVEPYLLKIADQKASHQLRTALVTHQKPITIIDEATGGALQSLLQTPETYPLLSFHKQKNASMRFYLQGLKEYWLKQSSQTTSLSIVCRNQQKEEREDHTIPYRSALVTYFAAEWLSYRLLMRIQQR